MKRLVSGENESAQPVGESWLARKLCLFVPLSASDREALALT
ncbi:MAG: hypothetical protein ACRYHQ_36400 [Janthinobacterium lividum]